MRSFDSVSATMVAVGLLVSPTAQAYIDPGTGSMLIQCTIAALVGIGFAFRNGFRSSLDWVMSVFRKTDGAPERDDDDAPRDEPPAAEG